MTDRFWPRTVSYQRIVMVMVAALWFVSIAVGSPQSSTGSISGSKPPTYDVVSVEPSKPGDPGMVVATGADSFSGKNVTLWALMYNAYEVRPVEPPKGLPGWGTTATFNIEAKMDEETLAALQALPQERQNELRRAMLRTVLADRFQLRIHHEQVDRSIYELVISNSGAKLKDAGQSGKHGGWVGDGQIQYLSSPISSLVFSLSNAADVGRPVVDKTGLNGQYDITLRWTPEDRMSAGEAGPSIFTALEEQLGLKLLPAKGPVDTIVVDHVERPSPN
jgi:uncharacterized protein (TIGR03435 family)